MSLKRMVDYTLSSYEEALQSYDQNVEDLKGCYSKDIEDLTEALQNTQIHVQNDQFLSSSEKNRTLKKREEGFNRIKRERERQLKVEMAAEMQKKEDFTSQNGGLDYHCFTALKEISKSKEERIGEINEELEKKKAELARLQAEIEGKQQEAEGLRLDLDSIKSKTLYDAFFDFDVMPKIRDVQLALDGFVEEHKKDYSFPQDFVDRTIRCLIKECKKQAKVLNYEGGKLKLSFNTVDNWTEGESPRLKEEVIKILTYWGFVVSKMKVQKMGILNGDIDASGSDATLKSRLIRRRGGLAPDYKAYLKEQLLLLNENDIKGRIDIIKQLGFSFANELAFIKQVETACLEGVDVIEDIDKWIQLYIIKPIGIEPRTSDDRKQFFKISLDCKQRNPRILMTMGLNGIMTILCVVPHIDYDNILRGQTTNYFQTWKGDWTKRGKQGRKTGRA